MSRQVSMSFEYALIRAVPRTDRGELVNIGVVLYCQDADFLGCATHLDDDRLLSLDAQVDLLAVHTAVHAVRAVCAGEPAGGRAAAGSRRERFGWLTAPRSTVVQPGPVHAGMTDDPAAHLARLLDRMVR